MRSSAVALLLGMVGLASACELPIANVPVRPSQVVVHGLLTTGGSLQAILVERTLVGEVGVTRAFLSDANRPIGSTDSTEPIASDGGIPVSDAKVELILPSGTTLVAWERRSRDLDGHGAGVYYFDLPGTSLVPGGLYQLKVTTKLGEVVTAETIVPSTSTAVIFPNTVPLNRDTDTLELSWGAVAGAAHYRVDVENPFTTWSTLTDSNAVTLPGTLRDVASSGAPRVFLPGFRQQVLVSAVDDNLYEYYRRVNNAFTSASTISNVKGGYGLFAASLPVVRRVADVSAPLRDTIDGRFQLVALPTGVKYGGTVDAQFITVYLESVAARSDQVDVLTGNYARASGIPFGGVVGKRSRNLITVAFLAQQRLTDTLETFFAHQRGDTLEGIFSRGTAARYVRVK